MSHRTAAIAGAAQRPRGGTTPAGVLQRKCACGGSAGPGGECEACRKKRLQRKAASQTETSGAVPSVVHDVLRSPGQPLDAATRSFFEPRFGHDFGRVRVHSDNHAAESARAVNADAYTVAHHVVFATARYQPATHAGQRLLAHELTHVVQQRGATGPPLCIDPPWTHFEADAEANAHSIFDGAPSHTAKEAASRVQRQMSGQSGLTTQFPDPGRLTYDQLVEGLLRMVSIFERASSTSLEQQDIEANVLPRYVQAFLRVASATGRPTTISGLKWGNPAHEKLLRLLPAPQPQPDFLAPPTAAQKALPAPAAPETALDKFVREHRKELEQLPNWNANFVEGLKRSDLGTVFGESWNELKENLTSAERGTRFYMGFVSGVPIGAAKDLYSQISAGLEFLLQMFLLNQRLQTDPLKVVAELRRFAAAIPSQLTSLLDANELGLAVGNQIASSITAGFVKQDPITQGRYLGEIAGAILMELALLFVGVEEVSAAIKAMRGTRLARGVGEGMSIASKELRAIMEARGVLKTEAKAAGDIAKEAKVLEGHGPKELPKAPDTAPAAPPATKPEPPPAQSKYPQELALGFNPQQIEAGKKFIGKRFHEVPELNFEAHWNSGLNPDHVRNARTGAGKDQVRSHFDSSRTKFWTRVFDDTHGAKKVIEDAGFTFEKRGNAPTAILPDGQVTALDVDHFTRLTDNPAIALDSNNLRLIFKRENRTVLEQLRRLEQRQFKPFRPGK